MKGDDRAGERREPTLEMGWAKALAALWVLGVAAAHYALWVGALLAGVTTR